MAQFRATIEGNRGPASRLGTKSSGITATINGWNIGVYVSIRYNEILGQDVIQITQTGGSAGQDPSGEFAATPFEKPELAKL